MDVPQTCMWVQLLVYFSPSHLSSLFLCDHAFAMLGYLLMLENYSYYTSLKWFQLYAAALARTSEFLAGSTESLYSLSTIALYWSHRCRGNASLLSWHILHEENRSRQMQTTYWMDAHVKAKTVVWTPPFSVAHSNYVQGQFQQP